MTEEQSEYTAGTELGRYLRGARQKRGFSQPDVARASGYLLDGAYVSQVETGKVKKPGREVLEDFAHALDLDLATLKRLAGYAEAPEDDAPEKPLPRTQDPATIRRAIALIQTGLRYYEHAATAFDDGEAGRGESCLDAAEEKFADAFEAMLS